MWPGNSSRLFNKKFNTSQSMLFMLILFIFIQMLVCLWTFLQSCCHKVFLIILHKLCQLGGSSVLILVIGAIDAVLKLHYCVRPSLWLWGQSFSCSFSPGKICSPWVFRFHVIVSSVTSNILCALYQFAMTVQILSLAGTPITIVS